MNSSPLRRQVRQQLALRSFPTKGHRLTVHGHDTPVGERHAENVAGRRAHHRRARGRAGWRPARGRAPGAGVVWLVLSVFFKERPVACQSVLEEELQGETLDAEGLAGHVPPARRQIR